MAGAQAAIGSVLLVLSALSVGGQRPLNCLTYQDSIGSQITHTDDRRAPCQEPGQREGSNCVHDIRLTAMDGTTLSQRRVQGCCIAEARGGGLFCSSPGSSEGVPAARVLSNAVGLQNKCKGGGLTVDNSVTEAVAREYGFELVCDASKGWTRECTRATGEWLCHCLLGSVVDKRQFCRCLEPNNGAQCFSSADCSGGGNCTTSAIWLEELAADDIGAADYFELKRLEDGSMSLQRKETSWYGDERVGTEPAAEVVWEYWEAEAGWQRYGEHSSAVLEAAARAGRRHAVIAGTAGGRGRVDLAAMEEITANILERQVRRTVTPGRVAHTPEKLNAESVEALPSTEALRRATVSP